MITSTREILKTLVEFPSATGDYVANHLAIEYIDHFLSTRGMHTQRFEADGFESLVATTHVTKNPKVLLAAHIDVMPAKASMFRVHHEEGKLTGRGVYDMKCAIAAYLEFVDRVQDHITDYDFGIMITSDEELGSKDNINGVQHLIKLGYIPEVCILPDGGYDWQLETSAKGYLHFTLEARGKTGHGSRPWLSDNAAYHLIDAIQDIRVFYKDQGPDTATVNVGVIEGGEAPNKVPDFMRCELETRPLDVEQFEQLQKTILSICQKHNVDAIIRAAFPPIYNSLDSPYLKAFAGSIEKVTGITVKGVMGLAGSDARHFAERGVPCAVFYPTGGGHHSEEEWIAQEAPEQMYAVIDDFMEKVALRKTFSDQTVTLETSH